MPQRINFTVRPRDEFEVPWSEGYQLYSAILNIIKDNNEEISKHAHDSPISSIAVSMLKGKFRKGVRDHHKALSPLNQYEFNLGITDPNEANIFQSIIQPILLEERDLKLDRGVLRIEEISNHTEKLEDIIDSIKRYKGTALFHNLVISSFSRTQGTNKFRDVVTIDRNFIFTYYIILTEYQKFLIFC